MTPFDWKSPYAWPRKPLLAQNVVSTSQPLAAQPYDLVKKWLGFATPPGLIKG